MANKVAYQENWLGEFKKKIDILCQNFGLPLSERQISDFCKYYDILVRTNEYMNLTGIIEPHEVAVKHMIDSLSCYDPDLFEVGATVLDLGTGAGFPGIPLAIYDRSLKITLFDSLLKRLHFLEDVIKLLNLEHVTVLHGRAEDLSHQEQYREKYDIVTTRAVARLPILAEWALPYVKKNGLFISLKGAVYEEELEDSKHAFSILGGKVIKISPITLPTLDDKRAVIYIKKEGITSSKYPRKPKEIKDKPL